MPRELKPKPQYSCEQPQEGVHKYVVHKLSAGDLDEEQVYHVHNGDGTYTCDCYAGLMGKFCRHLQMVDLFKANPDKIGSQHTYCWDRKQWM